MVFEFPTNAAAAAAGAAAYHDLVCTYGADPMAVRSHPEIAIGARVGTGSDAVAFWLAGNRVVELDYSLYGSRATALQDAAVTLRASWTHTHP